MVPTFLARLANFPSRAFGAMHRLRIRPDEAEASPPAFWYQGKTKKTRDSNHTDQPVNAADGLCYEGIYRGHIVETGLRWCGRSRARHDTTCIHQRDDGSLWEDHFSHACIGSVWFILTCPAPSLFWTVSSFNLDSSMGRTTRELIERRVTVWWATEHPDTKSENT